MKHPFHKNGIIWLKEDIETEIKIRAMGNPWDIAYVEKDGIYLRPDDEKEVVGKVVISAAILDNENIRFIVMDRYMMKSIAETFGEDAEWRPQCFENVGLDIKVQKLEKTHFHMFDMNRDVKKLDRYHYQTLYRMMPMFYNSWVSTSMYKALKDAENI